MECPYCGKITNQVIDSRPFQGGLGIKRRRKCLNCAGRFNTYESTEGNLVRILMRKDERPKTAIATVQAVGKSMSLVLKTLSEETENLIVKLSEFEKAKAKAVKKSKRKAAVKGRSKKKAGVKKFPARKQTGGLTDAARVLNVIKRHKKGVGLEKLRDRTGFQADKINSIVFRACKTGKIKRVRRGVYVSA